MPHTETTPIDDGIEEICTPAVQEEQRREAEQARGRAGHTAPSIAVGAGGVKVPSFFQQAHYDRTRAGAEGSSSGGELSDSDEDAGPEVDLSTTHTTQMVTVRAPST